MICMRRVCQRGEHVYDGILGGWGVSRSSLRPNTPPTGTQHPSLPSHTAVQRRMSHSFLLFTVCFSLYISSWHSFPFSAHELIFHRQQHRITVSEWVLKASHFTLLFSAHKVLMRWGGWVPSPLFHGTSFTGMTYNAWFSYQTITFLKCHSADRVKAHNSRCQRSGPLGVAEYINWKTGTANRNWSDWKIWSAKRMSADD